MWIQMSKVKMHTSTEVLVKTMSSLLLSFLQENHQNCIQREASEVKKKVNVPLHEFKKRRLELLLSSTVVWCQIVAPSFRLIIQTLFKTRTLALNMKNHFMTSLTCRLDRNEGKRLLSNRFHLKVFYHPSNKSEAVEETEVTSLSGTRKKNH